MAKKESYTCDVTGCGRLLTEAKDGLALSGVVRSLTGETKFGATGEQHICRPCFERAVFGKAGPETSGEATFASLKSTLKSLFPEEAEAVEKLHGRLGDLLKNLPRDKGAGAGGAGNKG